MYMCIPAWVNYHVTFITARKLSELHSSGRRRVRSATVGSGRWPWQMWPSIWGPAGFAFPSKQPSFLTYTASLGRVVCSVNHPRVAMNDVSEAAYRATWRSQFGVPDSALWWIMYPWPLYLFTREKVLYLVPWRLCFLLLLRLLSLAFRWWWFFGLCGGLWCKSEQSHQREKAK